MGSGVSIALSTPINGVSRYQKFTEFLNDIMEFLSDVPWNKLEKYFLLDIKFSSPTIKTWFIFQLGK